jgi:hypothetical protein
VRHCLVVANQTLGGKELAERLQELMEDGPCGFHIVVPITQTQGSDHAIDGPWAPLAVRDGYEVGRRLAEGRLMRELTRLRNEGAEADGDVVEPSPVDHIRELATRVTFDDVIVSTLPRRISRWLHLDLPHRIERATSLPMEHLISSAGPSL